ncbi:DUF3556 domain-containing protein [Aeromicrobium choanae]|uniref:DUF3556 domain-containing protein n=1 Tax=Aeromicrobium choanae TaxID=1736691 RepID=A0A1T4Z7S7_9ACTN|nr:DUF3556 domain-containing protein [Aeromicrobium choanae]SKB09903.1 Transmembrane protein of unknown function [Aeromicrobium choanae]
MGFTTADMPPVDPEQFEQMPVMDRMRMLALHWADYGFGGPKQMHALYLVKTVVFIVGGWLVVGLTTPGLGLFDLGGWWGELIVYQKLMVWIVLWEITGHAASWGPLSFKFGPFTGGWKYWTRVGTLRCPPYGDKIPGTAGSGRTVFDVALYLALVALLVVALVLPGQQTAAAYSEAGLIATWPLIAYVVGLLVMALRDKVVFLASRPEQYALCLLAFGVLASHVDMILVAKIAMVTIWLGAGVSKFGHHLTFVVQAMMSNTPWLTSKRFKRTLYRDVENGDLMPTRMAFAWAHIGGTVVELVLPLVLLFSTNETVTWLAIVGMMAFHLFIYSTYPLAVPLEWNIFFIFVTPFLFGGFFAGDGYGVGDFTSPWLLVAVLVGFLTGPILGNLKPEWVSFLISMRQYAGNWASGTMAFRMNGAEDKLDAGLTKGMKIQREQLAAVYGYGVAEVFLQKCVAFRSMHSHGRVQLALMQRHVDALENYRLREGEVVCTVLLGWQFGDGHLFDERTIAAVQERCGFEPGEWVTTFTESQPIHTTKVQYKVIDAALGVVERGWYDVRDAVTEQPWIPNGVKHTVTWQAPGYRPAGELSGEEKVTT